MELSMFRWILIAALITAITVYMAPRLQIFSMVRGTGGYGSVTGAKAAEKLPGEMFIRAMIDKGAMRRATVAEELDWLEGMESSGAAHEYQELQVMPKSIRADTAFVILEQIEFPYGSMTDGLVWGKTFIVPEGVPVPHGDPGKSALWIMMPHECRGGGCFGL
jgi:hypothetical protein